MHCPNTPVRTSVCSFIAQRSIARCTRRWCQPLPHSRPLPPLHRPGELPASAVGPNPAGARDGPPDKLAASCGTISTIMDSIDNKLFPQDLMRLDQDVGGYVLNDPRVMQLLPMSRQPLAPEAAAALGASMEVRASPAECAGLIATRDHGRHAWVCLYCALACEQHSNTKGRWVCVAEHVARRAPYWCKADVHDTCACACREI